MGKAEVLYFISLLILIIGAYAFMKTQNIVIRNISIVCAYGLWGILSGMIIKGAFARG